MGCPAKSRSALSKSVPHLRRLCSDYDQWTHLSQLWVLVHHIQSVKNECTYYISLNNFDDMTGAKSEEVPKEAFTRMDVHLDLNMTIIRPVDGLGQVEHLKEFRDIYKPCLG